MYSRFTLLVHKAKIINEQWKDIKELSPFGLKEEKIPMYFSNKIVDFEALEKKENETFEEKGMNDTFQSNFKENTSGLAEINNNLGNIKDFPILDGVNSKSVIVQELTKGTTQETMADKERREFINQIFDSDRNVNLGIIFLPHTLAQKKNISIFSKRTTKDIFKNTRRMNKSVINPKNGNFIILSNRFCSNKEKA